MSKILGKNVTLSIVYQGSPQVIEPIGCARTATLTTTANIAGKSTVGSGIWQEFTGLSMGWTVSVDGFTTVDENMDLATLRGLQFALTPIVISFTEVVNSLTIYYSGLALLTSVSNSGNYADAETYTVQMQGTGKLYQSRAFQIIDQQTEPTSGMISLTFAFDDSDAAASYTIRIYDLTDDSFTDDNGGNSPRTGVIIDKTHDYAFALKSEPSGDFGPLIYYP